MNTYNYKHSFVCREVPNFTAQMKKFNIETYTFYSHSSCIIFTNKCVDCTVHTCVHCTLLARAKFDDVCVSYLC